MLILTFTGLLNVALAVTLLLLITVILQKERPEDADNWDRLLLILFGVSFSASLALGGLLVMAGAAAGMQIEDYSTEALISNGLKSAAVVFGWAKIIRAIITRKRDN